MVSERDRPVNAKEHEHLSLRPRGRARKGPHPEQSVFYRVAERVTGQDVTLLNARRLIGGNRDQGVDETAETAT